MSGISSRSPSWFRPFRQFTQFTKNIHSHHSYQKERYHYVLKWLTFLVLYIWPTVRYVENRKLLTMIPRSTEYFKHVVLWKIGNLSFRGWNRNPFLDLSVDCKQKTTEHLGRRRLGRPAAVLEIGEEETNRMGCNSSVSTGMSFPLNIFLVPTGAFGCLLFNVKFMKLFQNLIPISR